LTLALLAAYRLVFKLKSFELEELIVCSTWLYEHYSAAGMRDRNIPRRRTSLMFKVPVRAAPAVEAALRLAKLAST
jgi:hypothetical protein